MRLIGGTGPTRSAVATLAALLVPCLILPGARAGEIACEGGNGAPSATDPPADPLIDLSQAFRESYARCRQRLVNRSGPVIVVEGDSLVLLHNGKRREAKVVPDVYHTLKAVSHVPLAVYVMLVPLADVPLDKECVEGLRS